MVSFLPGLALMKTTVLESMRTLSYFRLDTLRRRAYSPERRPDGSKIALVTEFPVTPAFVPIPVPE